MRVDERAILIDVPGAMTVTTIKNGTKRLRVPVATHGYIGSQLLNRVVRSADVHPTGRYVFWINEHGVGAPEVWR